MYADARNGSPGKHNDSWQWAKENLVEVFHLLQIYTSEPDLIRRAAAYHLNASGKMYRPMLALAAGHAVSAAPEALTHVAAATEFLHNASLVHDDLQDKDEIRRGQPTVWVKFGTETAINLGDYFISCTYAELSRVGKASGTIAKLVSLFANSTRQIIAGQSDEIEATRRLGMEVEAYHRIARRKSGLLIALPVLGALTLANADAETIDHARLAMLGLGVAYQIDDDINDLLGAKDGRPPAVDLREGRMSLPIIYFDKQTDARHRSEFRSFIRRGDETDPSEAVYWAQVLRKSGVLNSCRRDIDEAVRKAEAHLNALPGQLRTTLKCVKRIILPNLQMTQV